MALGKKKKKKKPVNAEKIINRTLTNKVGLWVIVIGKRVEILFDSMAVPEL
jgi:hypothetical protein